MDLIRLQIIVGAQDFGIWLMPGKQNSRPEDREYFRIEMKKSDYRKKFYTLLKGLGNKYWIEIGGETRFVNSFESDDDLWRFTTNDNLQYYFTIGQTYSPEESEISDTHIVRTITVEFDRLYPLYRHMKDKSFE